MLQTGEIKALAGVDYLTISPNLLKELKDSTDPVPQVLVAETGMMILKHQRDTVADRYNNQLLKVPPSPKFLMSTMSPSSARHSKMTQWPMKN